MGPFLLYHFLVLSGANRCSHVCDMNPTIANEQDLRKLLSSPAIFQSSGGTKEKAADFAVFTEGGDYGAGYIVAVQVAQLGKNRGFGYQIESSFLDQIVEFGNQVQAGVKCRAGHPNMNLENSVGKAFAAVKNFRRVGDKILADMHMLASAKVSPKGDWPTYVLSFANERQDFLALSVEVGIESIYYYDSKKARRVVDSWGTYIDWLDEGEPDLYITAASLEAVDLVDEGALTDGLAASALNASHSLFQKTPKKSTRMSQKRAAYDINATTTDQVDIQISTDQTTPKVGDEVKVISEDGTESPTPDGTHEIADGPLKGYKVETKDGKIDTITEPSSEAQEPAQGSQKPEEPAQASAYKELMARFDKLESRLGQLENVAKGAGLGHSHAFGSADGNFDANDKKDNSLTSLAIAQAGKGKPLTIV